MKRKSLTTSQYIAVAALFFAVLFGLRWSWTHLFFPVSHPVIEDGVLDLRGVDLEASPPFALDGEWRFYPSRFLSEEEARAETYASRPIQVPGDWRDALDPGGGAPSYGYGTYRLRILTDPLDKPVTAWLNRIQSASVVSMNGFSEGTIGRVAATGDRYEPSSISYTSTYGGDGATEIDLLVQVSNFDQPLQGGITRSVQFGAQSSVDFARWYSIGFQLIAFVVLLLHGFYALTLYLLNRRDRTFLLFSLLTMAAALTVTTDHDNLLLLWLPIEFAWGLKLRLLSYMWLSYLILVLYKRFIPTPPWKKGTRIYFAALCAYSAFVAIAPASWVYVSRHYLVFSVFYLVPFVRMAWLVVRMYAKRRSDEGSVFLLLAGSAVLSSVAGGVLNAEFDITPVYYPVDVIAAIIGFSSYWFQVYFRNARENAQLNERLRAADKLKDEFLANTSHELRTPLHGIMNIAENVMAKERGRLSDGALKDMDLLVGVSRRMSHLLNDLLDVARLQDGGIALRIAPMRIQAVVPGVLDMLGFLADNKPVRLRSDVPDTLPPVLADEQRVVQILYNLLHNAIKYTEEGVISVSAELADGRVAVSVSDTGIGMDEETQSRVFRRYEHETGGDGIGLGLNISHQLAELHGGTLTVRSAPGAGSVFRFDLPLAGAGAAPTEEARTAGVSAGASDDGPSDGPVDGRTHGASVGPVDVLAHGASAAEAPAGADGVPASTGGAPASTDRARGEASPVLPVSPVSPGSQPFADARRDPDLASLQSSEADAETAATLYLPPSGRARILAVDDDPVNLNVLAGILSSEPYDISYVRSAQDAIAMLGDRRWDLLIADVMMPRMSGYELTRRARERYSASELPILLLTARSQPADIYAGFKAGASDYVAKPVDAPELRYRIRALIALKRSASERLRMEAAYLQAQIQPHFVVNTLNAMIALGETEPDRMRELGHAFASFLRHSFDSINAEELVLLSHEIGLTEAYLFIERARFGDRLRVVWETDASLGLEPQVPPLSIQPLVENAVKHGVLRQSVGGTVRIRILRVDGRIRIEVGDDGVGMTTEQARQALTQSAGAAGRGVGLYNTNRRLKRLYGQGLRIQSQPGEGTVVSFEVPDRAARG
ncbi:hybrid sensor histidine kinase/response regulator [Cohnella sp. JJ-181]|uniref:hybrid sensor histidine kinase/response regulator n=1 Tax=Cohnella rhizoplanae TaxID=2974897 RepID=UPI00232F01E4|nr:ATP-binding protein [Cohnella sp. JJ-181]